MSEIIQTLREVKNYNSQKIHYEAPYLSSDDMENIEYALEKQISKKSEKSGVTDSKGIFHPTNGIDGVPYDLCPNCKTNLCTTGMFARKKMKYCQECGQKLDWGEENERY
ncbi:MAG: hypothetical protein ACLTBR_03080 [Anaerostipes sp.]|uniref:hypothetical protein n=1 Tax=Anaerostipes sp. TaxID=1872530 RepID=UPI003992FB0B